MRSILGLGALLLLLVPRAGGAHEAWGQQPRARLSLVPRTQAVETSDSELSRSLRSIDDTMVVSTEAKDPVAARVASEVLVGSLLGAGGLLGGGLVGVVLAESFTCGVNECMDGLGYVGASIVAGIALAAPLGVYFGGHLMEGEGLFLPTLAGSLVSGGVTAVTLAMMTNSITPAGVLVLAMSPLVGSIVGYEMSHFFVGRQRRSLAAGGVQVLPTAGVTTSGTGMLGLAGRF